MVQYRIIEPRINDILKRLNVKSVNLETISNFKLKEFILGSVPGRLGGIKAYDRNTDRWSRIFCKKCGRKSAF